MNLSQEAADTLRIIEKYLTDPELVKMPPPVDTHIHSVHYQHDDRRMDNMKISTYRARKNRLKVSYRLLYNGNVMLIRVDTQDATPHTNPDKKITIAPREPHVHIYREGYGDKFAYPLPKEFHDTENISNLSLSARRLLPLRWEMNGGASGRFDAGPRQNFVTYLADHPAVFYNKISR